MAKVCDKSREFGARVKIENNILLILAATRAC